MQKTQHEVSTKDRFFAPPAKRKKTLLNRWYVLWLIDVACVSTSLYFAYWLRINYHRLTSPAPVGSERIIAMMIISIVWTVIFAFEGLYRRTKIMAGLDQAVSIAKSITLGFLLLLGLSFVWKRYHYFVETRGVLALGWMLAISLLATVRIGIIRNSLRKKARQPGRTKRAAVVGAIPFARRFLDQPIPSANGYQILGFIETREGEISSDLGSEYVLGRIGALDEIVTSYDIEELFLPLALVENRQAFDIVSKCSRTGLPLRLVSDMFEILMPDESKEIVEGLPPISLGEPAIKGIRMVAKRAIDLTVSILVLVIFAPLFLLIALLIKISSPGPVLFKQIRAGKDGRPFTFYKFRTMRHDTDDSLHREYATNFIGGKELRLKDEVSNKKVYKMPNDPRVTPIGRILRRTSLDELPQIFNVIKGEMSLVGPRPPIAYELTVYKEWHKRRLRAKPGITGLWQVSGRSSVPFHDMVLLDLYYINRWSLRMDLEILLRTIPVVLSGKGAY